MSQENVEIARRMCAAAWRRPEPDYDTINALGHPSHELARERLRRAYGANVVPMRSKRSGADRSPATGRAR